MFPGYNTNGFAHHRLEDTWTILHELGYRGLALTVDYNTLNILEAGWEDRAKQLAEPLQQLGFHVVIETGARFLLDPRRKHQPTLLSSQTSERDTRIDFLGRCVRLAKILQADAVSFWSGTSLDNAPSNTLMERLSEGCKAVCGLAEQEGVRLAFEPEPGMLIDTMDRFAELHHQIAHPLFGLTLDIGHLQCLGEQPIGPHIQKWSQWLWNIHIEDMKQGIHDHLPFGEGEIDFDEVFQALQQINYSGGLYVELSRHSHNAVAVARQSIAFMNRWLNPSPTAPHKT